MLLGLWYKEGMSFNRECSQLSQGCKRLWLYFLLRRKNPDTFPMRICSWNEKMCLWLVFSFSQDSRFILSVRRSKRNEELSGLLFLRCVLQDCKRLLVFFCFFKRRKPILQIYMLLEMEETSGNIKRFAKGNSYVFGVGQYLMVRGHSMLKIRTIYGLWYKMLKSLLNCYYNKSSPHISKHPLGWCLRLRTSSSPMVLSLRKLRSCWLMREPVFDSDFLTLSCSISVLSMRIFVLHREQTCGCPRGESGGGLVWD